MPYMWLVLVFFLSACGGGSSSPSAKITTVTDDHGNTLATATLTQVNQPLTGILNTSTDIDVFYIQMTSPGQGVLVISPTVDTDVQLLDGSGALLISMTVLAGQESALPISSVYAVYVSLQSHAGLLGDYRMRWQWISLSNTALMMGNARFDDRVDVIPSIGLAYQEKPIRYADVEVIDPYGVVLASASTDIYGNYHLNLVGGQGKQVYIRVATRMSRFGGISSVQDNFGQPFATVSPTFIEDTATPVVVDLISSSATNGAAFNVLDCIVEGQDALMLQVGVSTVPGIQVLWFQGNNMGTYYDAMQNKIYLLGLSTDDDAYDDAVVMHEYGHFVLSHFSRDDSPGGSHYYTNNQQRLDLAWSEGWATFWSCYVRLYRGDRTPQEYLDTDGHGIPMIEYDIESLTQFGAVDPVFLASAMGMANEAAISAVLWDVVDSGNQESFDVITARAEHWQILQAMRRVAVPASMQDFIELWAGQPTYPNIQNILLNRSMTLAADSYEPDDILATAYPTLGVIQHRTFHYLADVDWISIDLYANQVYQFETMNLLNGADTMLELHDQQSFTSPVLAQNDDRCGVTASCQDLSSLIVYAPVQTGRYYLAVRRYIPPQPVARYGTYDLRVQ